MMPSIELSQGGERRPAPTEFRYATVGVRLFPPIDCCHDFTRYLGEESFVIFDFDFKHQPPFIELVVNSLRRAP